MAAPEKLGTCEPSPALETMLPLPGEGTAIELAIAASQRQARRAAMFVVLGLQTRPAPSERNAQRTFRPYGAWASWTAMTINIALLTELTCAVVKQDRA